MIKFLIALALVFLFLASLPFRCIVLNPFKTIFYTFKDLFFYFKHKKYNNARYGQIDCYVGLFGHGKTLTLVHLANKLYKRYDNKKVWDEHRKSFVTQKVLFLSNVNLSYVPFVHFRNLNQIIEVPKQLRQIDQEENTLTVLYVLVDEASTVFNSRNFKSNFSVAALGAILTCRHSYMSLFLTSQRFNHCDALLRQVCQNVISCEKLYRFQRMYVYDAYEMENCNNPTLLKAKRKTVWFVRDHDYHSYDTFAVVDDVVKDVQEGAFLSDQEIIQLRNNGPEDMDQRHWSKSGKKIRNKAAK